MTGIFNKLSVKWRLAGFVFFLLLVVIGAGLGGLTGMKRINTSLSRVYHDEVLPLKVLGDIDNLLQDRIVASVDKILFEQITWEQGLRNVETANTDLEKKWESLFVRDDAMHDNSWIDPALELIEKEKKVNSTLIALLNQKDGESLDSFTDDRLYPLADEHRKIVNDLVENRLEAVKKNYEDAQQGYALSKKGFLVVLIISILISSLASVLLIRGIDEPLSKITEAMKLVMKGDLTHRLEHGRHDEFGLMIKGFNQMSNYLADLVAQIQQSGIQVTSSITQLAATNKEQEVTANEHAATTSEIAASTAEIASTGQTLLTTMKKVNSLTKNAAFAAEQGHAGLRDIDKTMVTMEEATGGIVAKLQILSEKAGNIAGVVQTINKVADQTNLLSLNAAIEAEKAGEYGAGFAVVATEIRRLADQTAVATFDIEQMVQEVQTAISSAVMGIDKFAEDAHHSVEEVRKTGEQLAGVIDQVEILTPQVSTLTEGIEAQTLGANQISEAISQLNEAAQQTAESLSQTSSSISQLHRAAMILQDGAARFKVEQAKADDASSSL